MQPLDAAIVGVYRTAVFLVGSLFFRGLLSRLAAVSFLGAPGQAFKSDLRFLQYRLGTPIAIAVIGWVMLPFFYRLQVFSIYEYLENRFDLRTRLAGGIEFFLLKLLYLVISIYAPALLFVEMTGPPVLRDRHRYS